MIALRPHARFVAACVIQRHVPGIRDHLHVLDVGTPVTNLSYVCAPEGACYGPDFSPGQAGSARYSIEGALPGLYFCGSSTFGASVVYTAISGFSAEARATSTNRFS